jgi:hypothetical protein
MAAFHTGRPILVGLALLSGCYDVESMRAPAAPPPASLPPPPPPGAAMEPPAPPSGDIAGDYVGEISINGRSTRLETHLRTFNGTIDGSYVYGPRRTMGQLSDCRVGEGVLQCRWTEPVGSGTFRVSIDVRGFSGNWEQNGRRGGRWTGRRSGVSAGPPPTDSLGALPAMIAGRYSGSIVLNGNHTLNVETVLEESSGELSGSYVYGASTGVLRDCEWISPRLACTWVEGSLAGGFRVDFGPDLRSFSGGWDFSNGQPGGGWSGRR